MVSNTETSNPAPVLPTPSIRWNQPLLKLGLISQPLTGSNTGGSLFLELVRLIYPRYVHRPFSSGRRYKLLQFSRSVANAFPRQAINPVVPFGEPGTDTARDLICRIDRRRGTTPEKTAAIAPPNTSSWREPPSRPKILCFSAPDSDQTDCVSRAVLLNNRHCVGSCQPRSDRPAGAFLCLRTFFLLQ